MCELLLHRYFRSFFCKQLNFMGINFALTQILAKQNIEYEGLFLD
jgi:hypothetical protein